MGEVVTRADELPLVEALNERDNRRSVEHFGTSVQFPKNSCCVTTRTHGHGDHPTVSAHARRCIRLHLLTRRIPLPFLFHTSRILGTNIHIDRTKNQYKHTHVHTHAYINAYIHAYIIHKCMHPQTRRKQKAAVCPSASRSACGKTYKRSNMAASDSRVSLRDDASSSISGAPPAVPAIDD